MVKWHLNLEGNCAVADNFLWQDMNRCPTNVKCLLLTKGGTAVVGTYNQQEWFEGWAPLPRIWRKDEQIVEHERRMNMFEAMKDDE